MDAADAHTRSSIVMNPSTSVSVLSSSRRLPSYHRNQNPQDSCKHEGRCHGTRLRTSVVNKGSTKVQPDKDVFIPVMSRRGRRAKGCGEAAASGLEGAPPLYMGDETPPWEKKKESFV